MTNVINIQHWLDEQGDPAPAVRRQALRVARLIEYGGPLDVGYTAVSEVRSHAMKASTTMSTATPTTPWWGTSATQAAAVRGRVGERIGPTCKACDDGADNDGDGRTTQLATPAASVSNDNTESCSGPTCTQCNNGIDVPDPENTKSATAAPGCSGPFDLIELDGAPISSHRRTVSGGRGPRPGPNRQTPLTQG